MIEREYSIIEEAWGLIIKFQKETITNSSNVPAIIDDVLNASKKSGKSRILWDSENIIRKSSVTDSYNYANMVEKKNSHPIRVAVFSPEPVEDARFIENLYHNRGMQVQFFYNRKEAIGWLRGF